MKKQLVFLIILSLFMTVCVPTVKAQVFVTVEPSLFHAGVLYNQKNVITHLFSEYNADEHFGKIGTYMGKIGLYGRIDYGRIKTKGEIWEFCTNNVKIGVGLHIPIEENVFALYFGPNYNHFFNTSGSDPYLNIEKVHPISIDIGVSRTKGRFTMLMMSDLPNWEALVGFSYRFGNKHKAEKEVCKIGSKRFKHFN